VFEEFEESISSFPATKEMSAAAVGTRFLVLTPEEAREFKQQQILKYQRQQEENQRQLSERQARSRLDEGIRLQGAEASIAENVLRRSGFKVWTEYKICISVPGVSWFVWKRYNDFYRFDKKLRQKFAITSSSLPMLPPKRRTMNLDPSFVQERQRQLQSYLEQLLRMVQIANSKYIRLFLIQ